MILRNTPNSVEKNDSVGYHYVLKIHWISDCKYELTLLENKSSNPQFTPPSNGFHMSVIITEVLNKSFKISASLNEGKYQYAGTIHQIIH